MAGIKVTGLKETVARFKRAEQAVNAKIMGAVATYGQNIIKQRTDKGEFLNGSKKGYSKAGALFPISGGAKLKEYYRSKLKGSGKNSNARFVYLENGYFQFRQLTNKQVAFVNLNYTGKMLNGMRSVSAGNNKATISFERAEDRIKAYYLSMAGAGKNKVVYEFFGFSEAEKNQLMQVFETEVTEWLKATDVL